MSLIVANANNKKQLALDSSYCYAQEMSLFLQNVIAFLLHAYVILLRKGTYGLQLGTVYVPLYHGLRDAEAVAVSTRRLAGICGRPPAAVMV